MKSSSMRPALVVASWLACVACVANPPAEYYGTTEPFASQAVYFVLTDRCVDGDSAAFLRVYEKDGVNQDGSRRRAAAAGGANH